MAAGRARALLSLAAVAALAVGCERHDPLAEHRAAEARVVAKQIAGLEELIRAAEARTLLRPDQFVVGVGENVLRELLSASLPQERVIGRRYRVRLESASVSFQSSQSLITLRGHVASLQASGTFALLLLEGGLEQVNIEAGRLTGRVVLHHFEVEQAAAAGTARSLARSLVEDLGHERLDALEELIPKIEIPVHLEEAIELSGVDDGVLRIAAGRLPVRASVVRVMPLSGRLWILLDATAGPWLRLADARQER
jgi:hypothetical protein